MSDAEVVDIVHGLTITQLGIRNKIYDRDFLMCLVDLITHRGPTITLGKHLTKAIPYFISGIKFNMAGTNAAGKVQRDQNICANITLLTVIAQNIVGLDYAKHVGAHFDAEVKQALE